MAPGSASSALVTGGASGLGAATAARLAGDGYAVVRLDLAEGEGVLRGDVTLEEDVASAVAAAVSLAPLRVCVTCAGIARAERLVGARGTHALDSFRATIEVNLIGTFNALRLAAAAMAANEPDAEGQRGVIVLTSSIAAFDGQVGQAAYAASKGAIASLVLPAARDLARNGIRSAPSIRIVSPFSITLSTTCATSAANSSGRPSRDGFGTAAPSASREAAGRPARSGVSNVPGATAQTRMPLRARSRAAGRTREAIAPFEAA